MERSFLFLGRGKNRSVPFMLWLKDYTTEFIKSKETLQMQSNCQKYLEIR